jgi:transcriptional regulator with XRE-family HTH domain
MAKKQQLETWGVRLVAQAGKSIRRARRKRDLTANQLSDLTADLGLRISPTVIAKLDSGHRGSVLNVDELLVLAAALNIPPMLLLFPGYPEQEVEFLPGRTALGWEVADWFSGRDRIPSGEGEIGPWNVGIELVQAVDSYSDSKDKIRTAEEMPDDAPYKAEMLKDAVRQFQESMARIEELSQQLRKEN